ncbi:glycosyltransferase family 39 protein [Parvularcula sp. IMCC14364]|uniref:glycosyltransferase family 39 protein n=1 Tax=Parvularcula sp. IMCC14364 TaxID=3067902 RepID=UPI002741D489|nr:glycosyltransferase family 39 protein [Parvularcula sp. IMCC14364]
MFSRARRDFEPFSLAGVLVLTSLFGLANALVRLTAGVNLALDDTKENIFTQKFSWGYLPDNPPLYEWILTLVQQATGPTLFSFLIVKYILMTITALFLFLAGRRLFRSEKWAALTVFSCLLLYQLGYNYHQAFTHSLVVIAAVAFSLWTLVRLVQQPTFPAYMLFGFSVGLGLLSKYNFTGFLAVMLLSGLLDRDIRKRLLNWPMLGAMGLAALIAMPHFLWVQDNQALFVSYVANKLGQTDGGYFPRVGEGIGNTLVAVISFYLPFLLLAPGFFRGALTPSHLARLPEDHMMRLLERSSTLAFLLIMAGVFLFGISNVTERYVIPFFLPGFFWIMFLLKNAGTPERVRRWSRVLVGAALFLLFVRFIGVFYPGAPVCEDCQRWRPYAQILGEIRKAELDEQAVYIGYEENTAGNLRRLMPGAAVRSYNLLFYNPIEDRHADKPCYFVWSEELLGQPVEQKLRHITDQKDTLFVNAQWRHPMRPADWRQTQWGISPIPVTDPAYENLCTS